MQQVGKWANSEQGTAWGMRKMGNLFLTGLGKVSL